MKRLTFRSRIAFLAILFLFCQVVMAEETPDRSDANKISLGTVTNISGASHALADELNLGLKVIFNKTNKSGGINGRKINHIIYDDAYEPKNTIEKTKILIEKDKVFALVAFPCTPCAKAIMPLINSAKIPLYAPFSGAEFLRSPSETNVYNLKAGYVDEISKLVEMSVNKLKNKIFCSFYQDDSLGTTGNSAAAKTLAKFDLKLKATASYTRNTTEVQEAMMKLKAAGCDTVLLAGQSKQSADFIRASLENNFNPVFLGANLIGTDAFIESVAKSDLKQTLRVFITRVFPSPDSNDFSIIKSFREDMAKFEPKEKLTAITFEGYFIGASFVEILKKVPTLTRESLDSFIENLQDFKVGGINLSFDKETRELSKKIYINTIKNKKLVLAED